MPAEQQQPEVQKAIHAWDNGTWVLGVMHLHDDPAQLEHIRRQGDLPHTRGSGAHRAWKSAGTEASRDGQTAGHVAMLMYTLAVNPWQLRPRHQGHGLRLALHCTVEMGKQSNAYLDSPAGQEQAKATQAQGLKVMRAYALSDVKRCWRERQSIAHLWGALTLIKRGFTRVPWPEEKSVFLELMDGPGLPMFLGIARTLQNFLYSRGMFTGPWAIAEHIPPVIPRWAETYPSWGEPASESIIDPRWLHNAVDNYRRENVRGKVTR